MRKVANRAPIRHLAVRMIKKSGKKNIPLICAIFLTTMLFTTLFSVGISMLQTEQKSTMRQVGGSDMASFKYGTVQDYDTIRADHSVKKCSYRIIVGELVNAGLKNNVTEVNYAQDENARSMFCYPTTGHMPQKINEAAVSRRTLDELKIPAKLGQRMVLDIKVGEKTYHDTFTLCGYWDGDPVAMSQECFVSEAYQQKRAPSPEKAWRQDMADSAGYYMIDFDFKNSFDIRGKLLSMLYANGYDLEEVQYGINWAYAWSTVDASTIVFVLSILFLIMAAGYLIIYNIFQISVTSDIREYGMLKTIGTTEKQLKWIVRFRACYLAAAAIPAGLAAGTILARLFFPMVLDSMEQGEESMVFSVHPAIYLFAVVFTLVTVLIGCRKPCRVAGKVSPVEAVSYTEISGVHKKNRRVRKVTSMQLAGQNFGREKKRAAVVICSMTMALVLTNGIYAVIRSLDADLYVSQSIIGDFSIQNYAVNSPGIMTDENSVVDEETVRQLGNLDGVMEQSNIYCSRWNMAQLTPEGQKLAEQLKSEMPENFWDTETVDTAAVDGKIECEIYGMEKWGLEQLDVEEGELDWKKFATGKYVIADAYQLVADTEDGTDSYPFYHAGDSVTLYDDSGTVGTYEVLAVAQLPYALSTKSYSTMGCRAILPESEFLQKLDASGALYSILNAEPGKEEQLGQQIRQITEHTQDLTVVSRQTYLDEFYRFVHTIEVVGGTLAGILALIGIMNFANAIITGIRQRAGELAMLEAVGMTRRQMTAMLLWEGIYYAILTAVLSLVVFALLGKFLLEAAVGEIWFFSWHFTVLPILCCIPVFLVLAVLIPLAEGKRMQRSSVVERMRFQE